MVVASHGRDEVEVLAAALDAGVPYIGLVASRRRGAGVLAELAEARPDLARIAARPGAQPGRPGHRREDGCRDCAVDPGGGGVDPAALGRARQASAQQITAVGRGTRQSAGGEPAGGSGSSTAIDPVCGMTVAAVESSLHLDHDGNPVLLLRTRLPASVLGEPGGFAESPAAEPVSTADLDSVSAACGVRVAPDPHPAGVS